MRAQLAAAAAAAGPAEACGLLLGARAGAEVSVVAATAARNVAADPKRGFEIDPGHLLAALRRARAGAAPEVVGLWHSHPSGVLLPSAADRAGVSDPAWLWLIVSADGARMAAFLPAPGAPLGFRQVPLDGGRPPADARIDLGRHCC